MSDLRIRVYAPEDEAAVIALWERCDLVRPWNDPRSDIAAKLAWQPDLFFIGELRGRVVGSVMVGYEGHRGWVNYLAVEPSLQSDGYGRELMEAAESRLRELGCPKLNLQVRSTNERAVGFYERLGFTREDNINLGKRLDGRD